MKLTSKFPAVILAGMLIMLNTISCSKKNTPVPAKPDTTPATVYDIKNTAAIYPTTGMAVDASGNLYVADVINSIIKMYTPGGVATTIAGNGTRGSSNRTGTGASFNFPSGLAIDAAKNIYVADAANNMIRKISPFGVVSTLAGSGTVGAANGPGTMASFSFPQGIAVDINGNIYVADTGNDLIRKISPDGMVSTLAGKVAAGKTNGIGTDALFNIPQGLAVDVHGNVYVADAGNNLIRKITPLGAVTTLAGSGYAVSSDGTGVLASFNFPNAISIDNSGILYVTEGLGNRVSRIGTDNYVSALPCNNLAFGGQIDFRGAPSIPLPVYPNGMAIDSRGGSLIYVLDYGNGWIELY
jgi:sugar lactone lactonase YvrE